MTDLGTLGGKDSIGREINASGQIVGYARTKSGLFHAVIWTGATAADLGSFSANQSFGIGINTFGEAVGTARTAQNFDRPFFYTGGRLVDCNTLLPLGSGWTGLGYATAINDKGWITGVGTIHGQGHAFLLRPNGNTVFGGLALEGVKDLTAISPAAPLGAFHLSLRSPGATGEIYGADFTLTPLPNSAFGTFAVSNLPSGVYDIAIKGAKNLRGVLRGVTLSARAYLPNITLSVGDANNDNAVDASDFGVLVGAYNGDSTIPGSGYDPAADFNFDGVVDTQDFALLVGEYGAVGAM